MKPTVASRREKLFPVFRPSFASRRVGLEYGMTVQGKPMQLPNVAQPVRSSLAQNVNVHRFQLSRNLKLLRNYGMRPDYPVLRAPFIPFQAKVAKQTPTPQMTRFGSRPTPGLTPVYPRVAKGGTMGSVKRFAKASKVIPNRYRPPIYGGGMQPSPGSLQYGSQGNPNDREEES